MKGNIEVFHYGAWQPFLSRGFTSAFWTIHSHTIFNTWLIMALFISGALIARFLLSYHQLSRFALLQTARSFAHLCEQTLGRFIYRHFSFVFFLFTFILCCNVLPNFLPHVGEPTTDPNTTFALGLISFLYVQYYSIVSQGFFGYLNEYITPFFVMAPMHVISKIASIISISFRLFGNIFGGAIIIQIFQMFKAGSIVLQIIGLITGLNIIILAFFGIFEGLIQAFVFAMLTLTYTALGTQTEHGE